MSAITRCSGPAARTLRLSLRCSKPSSLLLGRSSLVTSQACRSLSSSSHYTTAVAVPKLATSSIKQQPYHPFFRTLPLPMLPSRRGYSTPSSSSSKPDPPEIDDQHCLLPLPPDVRLPPLPDGWARLSPEETQALIDIIHDAASLIPKAHLEKSMWTQCYIGIPEESANLARGLVESKGAVSADISMKDMFNIVKEMMLQVTENDEDLRHYYSHPVIRDILENKRWDEWRFLDTKHEVQLSHIAPYPQNSTQKTVDKASQSRAEAQKSDQDQKQTQKSSAKEEGKRSGAVPKSEEAKKGETPKREETKAGAFGPAPPPRQSSFTARNRSGSSKDRKKDPKKDDKDGGQRIAELVAYGLTLGFVWALFDVFTSSNTEREITWQELRRNFLDKGLVEKLIVSGQRVRVDLNLDATRAMYPDSVAANPYFHYYFSIGSIDAFERKVEEAQSELGIPSSERIPISYKEEGSGFWGNMLISWGSTILFVGLLVWMSRSGRGGGTGGFMSFQKSKAKRFNHETSVPIKFADVAGADEAKVEIMEFVSFLKTPERFQRLGAKIPRGAILSGPPGTGKTLLAKATAGESNVPFFSVSGSEFVEMFVGVGASRVRDLFATARKNAPCIIFIDEIDAVGKQRSAKAGGFGGNEEREATLNQILTEMDGFNTSDQVVVLAGTNRPDMLDKALTRPGRFDRHITIDRPTMKGRADIFLVHLKKIVTQEDLPYLCGRLSALTPGFAGADIANAVNEAALIAARENAETVRMTHFEQAIERVIAGLERKSLVLSKEEKRTVAYHEAGHAICGWYFQYADPLLKVSIIPRGQGALGYAQYLPSGDAYLMSVHQLMDRMAMTLGGRVSEELHFPTVTTGASDDFKKVTQMATTMVTQWGMSEKLGPLHFNQDQNQWQKPFAEATAQTIDAEVRRIIDEAYKKCKDLLTSRKKEIGIIAEELLRKEVLTRDDLVRLLGHRQWKDRDEFSKYFEGEQGGKLAPPPFATENTDSPQSGPADTAPTAEFKGQEDQRQQ